MPILIRCRAEIFPVRLGNIRVPAEVTSVQWERKATHARQGTPCSRRITWEDVMKNVQLISRSRASTVAAGFSIACAIAGVAHAHPKHAASPDSP